MSYASGPQWARREAKFEKINFSSNSARILAFSSQSHSRWPYNVRANGSANGDPFARAPSNVEGPAAARARSGAACGGGERARQSDSTYAQLVDMMSRIVAHNGLRDGSTRPARGEPTEQKSTRRGENLDCSVDPARFLSFTR